MKIVDSSCLICLFNEINRPFILMDWTKRGYRIVITDQVYRELQKNDETHKQVELEIQAGRIKVESIVATKEFEEFRNRYPVLGAGELSVILTAIRLNTQNKRYYAIIDDKKARTIAKSHGVNLTGTYGLLETLKNRQLITVEQFEECKDAMNKSKFRINFEKIQ